MQENKKMNQTKAKIPFSRQFVMSVRGSSQYPELLEQGSGRAVTYFFCLVAIAWVFATLVPSVGALVGVGGIRQYLQTKIPEFTLQGGSLTMEYPLDYTASDLRIHADTSVDAYQQTDIDVTLYTEVLISTSNVIIYTNGLVQSYQFSDFSDVTMNKHSLLNAVPMFYMAWVFYLVLAYLAQAVSALFMILLLSLMGLLPVHSFQIPLKFGQLMIIATYATTIVTLLEALNNALHLGISSITSIVGMVWTTYVFYVALRACSKPKGNGNYW